MTGEAFICDAVRTPDRPLCRRPLERPRRRSGGDPDAGLDGAPSAAGLAAPGRCDPRLRQPGGRGQSQRRPHGVAAGGAAGRRRRVRRSTASAAPGSTRSPMAARAIKAGEGDFDHRRRCREHEPRAVRACPRPRAPSPRRREIHDTTIGWRFVNPKMEKAFGVDPMRDTAENVAEEYQVTRADQDAFALRSQQQARPAQAAGRFADEIVAGARPQARPRAGRGRR